MDIISAYRQVGSYRGAAELCGTTHKTVKRVIEWAEAGRGPAPREPRPRNVDAFTELAATRVEKSKGKMPAKRMLPIAGAAGYQGSARNFRGWWRSRKCCGATLTGISAVRRCGTGRVSGGGLGPSRARIDGVLRGTGVFVVAVRAFAADEKASTRLAMIAEALDAIGGVPAKVLADRTGCLKAVWLPMSLSRSRITCGSPPITGSTRTSATVLIPNRRASSSICAVRPRRSGHPGVDRSCHHPARCGRALHPGRRQMVRSAWPPARSASLRAHLTNRMSPLRRAT